MLLNFFKRPLPVVFSSIIVLAILLWLQSFVTNQLVQFSFDKSQMPLYALLTQMFNGNNYIARIIVFAILLTISFYLVHLNSKHILIKQRSYFPSLMYILLTSSFLPLQRLNPAIFACLLILIAINYLFSLNEGNNPLDNLFKAGMFVSLAVMFYLPVFLYMFLVFIAIGVLKTSTFRDYIVALSGFLTPWFFYFSFQYLVYDNPLAPFHILDDVWHSGRTNMELGLLFKIYCGFIGLLFTIATLFLLKSLSNQKIHIRKYYTVLLWFVAITIFIMLFLPSFSIEMAYIAAFPAAFFVSNYLLNTHNRFWRELFLITMFAMAIAMQFF